MKILVTIIKTVLLIFALLIGWVFMTCDVMAGGLWIILCITSYGAVYGIVEEYRENKAK
jgi:hypothetical protein|uniref:Uncharacterized protein n=1 Tax=virus sp. ctmTa7 TaxID=2828255 RepID=A0A8S5RCR1_9VIRU|nr:MAG TPA: hypothetical protein [virus sp. ctmTa7]